MVGLTLNLTLIKNSSSFDGRKVALAWSDCTIKQFRKRISNTWSQELAEDSSLQNTY